ncbi:hypothetical protein SNL152K_1322 [Streptomyces sp. NL15-2K]|nr:hypothetical protein SNL152K_1322 [Streptomyces sp. NL15-2K]
MHCPGGCDRLSNHGIATVEHPVPRSQHDALTAGKPAAPQPEHMQTMSTRRPSHERA